MDTYRAIVDKRDRRNFLPKPIPEDALHRILQAGRMTGSSKNAEPNRFVVVKSADTLAAMGAAGGPIMAWLGSAAVVVVIVQVQEHAFDAGRCAQNMMLAAWNEGIGSCPAHVPERELMRILGIPESVFPNRVVGFGYIDPERAHAPRAVSRKRLPLDELVHEERW